VNLFFRVIISIISYVLRTHQRTGQVTILQRVGNEQAYLNTY